MFVLVLSEESISHMKTAANKTGEVVEALPNLEYRIHIDGTPEEEWLRCMMAGKMRLNKIRVFIGDKVEVVHTPDMGEIGRIVWKR